MKSISTGENGTEGARSHQIRSKWSRTLRGKIILELSNHLMQWETEEKKKADEMQKIARISFHMEKMMPPHHFLCGSENERGPVLLRGPAYQKWVIPPCYTT